MFKLSKEDEELIDEDLYKEAKNLTNKHRIISPKLLRNKLSIGYYRSGVIIEMLKKENIIDSDGNNLINKSFINMKNIYKISKEQFSVVIIFGIIGFFTAISESEYSSFATFLAILIPAILIFYVFGWMKEHKTGMYSKEKDQNPK